MGRGRGSKNRVSDGAAPAPRGGESASATAKLQPAGRLVESPNGVMVLEHPTGKGGDRRYRLIYDDGSEHTTGYWPDYRRALVTAPQAPAGARLQRIHYVPKPDAADAWQPDMLDAARTWLSQNGIDPSTLADVEVRAALSGRYDGGEEMFRRRHEPSDPLARSASL